MYEKLLGVFKRTCKKYINFENKKIIPQLKREELKSHQDARKFFLTKASQKLNN